MKPKSIELYYDAKGDILEIIIGEPSSCVFDEVDDDVFEARDERTNELKGYKVMNFRKRGGMKSVRIPLPANVVFE